MNLRSKGRVGLALAALCAIALAQSPSSGSFKDKAGNMEVRRIKSWRIQPEKNGVVRCTFVGGPLLEGSWKEQRMRIMAASLEATVQGDASKAYTLVKGTMSGQVTVTVQRGEASRTRTVTLRAGSATYTAGDQKVMAERGITVDSDDPAADQTLHATGSSGTLHLSPPGSQTALEAAILSGPVTMKLVSSRVVEEGGKTRRVPYTVNGSGNRLEYDAKARTIALIGNVVISGDDPVFGADVEAAKATITLTTSGEIEIVDFEGDPTGRTSFSSKNLGGGASR